MTYIFEHTDKDGDRVRVEEDSVPGTDVVLYLETLNVDDNEGVYLTRSAVDRLRAALAPYGTKVGMTIVNTPATDIVAGREYRLLPNAETMPGVESSAVDDRVTRVRVVNPDSGFRNGTVRVKGLDGRANEYIVMPGFLAPLTDEAPAAVPAPLDPRRVAAWHKARELAGSHADTYDVLRLTEFLLGEAA